MNQFVTLTVAILLTTAIARAAMPVAGEETPSSKPGIVVPAPVGSEAAKTVEKKTEDLLRFRSGDLLRGSLLGVSIADGLRWAHPQAKTPLAFELAGLHEVIFGARPEKPAGAVARVRLTNGDALAGELAGLTDEALKLQTPYAGSVLIKRVMLAAIEPNINLGTQLYTGPNSLAEWQRPNRGNSGWSFRKGALIANAGGGSVIGRDVKLPELASIEWDLAWQGYPSMYMLLYVENFEDYYSTECYALQMSGSTVYLQRATRGSGMNNVEQPFNYEGLQRRNKVRFALKINKTKRTFALFADGKFIKQWTDDNPFNGRGTGIGFSPQGNPVRISNITITDWDGRLDLEGSTSKDAGEDFVRLANGDKLSGKLGNIANGQVALTTSYATMQVPLERIAEVLLAGKDKAKPRRQPTDIYAFFPDGNRITLALDKLDANLVSGGSESFGKLNCQRGAFQRIQFNIYEPKPESDEEDDFSPSPSGAPMRLMR
jgi:hypothetical protein